MSQDDRTALTLREPTIIELRVTRGSVWPPVNIPAPGEDGHEYASWKARQGGFERGVCRWLELLGAYCAPMSADDLGDLIQLAMPVLSRRSGEAFNMETLEAAAKANPKGFFPAIGQVLTVLDDWEKAKWVRDRERFPALPAPVPAPAPPPSAAEKAAVRAKVAELTAALRAQDAEAYRGHGGAALRREHEGVRVRQQLLLEEAEAGDRLTAMHSRLGSSEGGDALVW